MNKKIIFSTAIIFSILLLSACGVQKTPTPEIPMLTQPAQTSAPTNTLTLASFNNATVFGLESQKTVTLSNGTYEGGSGADYLKVMLLPQAAFADLNGDGKEDAVLLLAENMGGSGTFVSLNVMTANDTGFTQAMPVLIDDRPLINSLTIDGSRIVLDAVIHGVSDSMAQPTMKALEEYGFENGGLVLREFSSTISDAARKIVIDSPAEGQEVSSPVELKGSMSIAPFENTLVYKVYDASNQVVGQGPFMVSAADMGQPATFDNTIALSGVAAGSRVRVELTEQSMADGSTLCMNSVEVVVK